MAEDRKDATYRHRLPVRVMHWTNALCLVVLFMSGLQIFNAHPALYWGQDSRFDAPALAMVATKARDGSLRGETRIGSRRFDTTGVLGVSRNARGVPTARGFPAWATIPGPRNLAEGRRWHFFFAWLFVINGIAYALWSWRSRHLRRDLVPDAGELRGIGASVRDHLRFRHDDGGHAGRYNVLQKLAYLGVIFVLGPAVVLMGLAMSPQLHSVLSGVIELVGGRQSARTWHFIIAFAFLAFLVVHVGMVLVSRPVNQVRAMLTGWYRAPRDRSPRPRATDADGEAP